MYCVHVNKRCLTVNTMQENNKKLNNWTITLIIPSTQLHTMMVCMVALFSSEKHTEVVVCITLSFPLNRDFKQYIHFIEYYNVECYCLPCFIAICHLNQNCKYILLNLFL